MLNRYQLRFSGIAQYFLVNHELNVALWRTELQGGTTLLFFHLAKRPEGRNILTTLRLFDPARHIDDSQRVVDCDI